MCTADAALCIVAGHLHMLVLLLVHTSIECPSVGVGHAVQQMSCLCKSLSSWLASEAAVQGMAMGCVLCTHTAACQK
jgi:hypothetical protein